VQERKKFINKIWRVKRRWSG